MISPINIIHIFQNITRRYESESLIIFPMIIIRNKLLTTITNFQSDDIANKRHSEVKSISEL